MILWVKLWMIINMKEPHVEQYIKDLKDTWSYTTEELNDIRKQMISFALDALHDKTVAEELFKFDFETEE